MNDTIQVRAVIAEQPRPCGFIRSLLEGDRDVAILAEASNCDTAIDLVRHCGADVLVVEYALLSDLPLTPSLAERSVPARVLVMLDSPCKEVILDAFRKGAHGILLRTSTAESLSRSIRSAVNGNYWPPQDAVGSLVDALREAVLQDNNHHSGAGYGLTRRELDIIAKIVVGRSNREMSEEFSISERTVKHHLTNIFDKLGVTSRLQLALFAVNHRLTERQSAFIVSVSEGEV
jgi:two-component system, NarL family, nitrate/nitrite response regulator NarL